MSQEDNVVEEQLQDEELQSYEAVPGEPVSEPTTSDGVEPLGTEPDAVEPEPASEAPVPSPAEPVDLASLVKQLSEQNARLWEHMQKQTAVPPPSAQPPPQQEPPPVLVTVQEFAEMTGADETDPRVVAYVEKQNQYANSNWELRQQVQQASQYVQTQTHREHNDRLWNEFLSRLPEDERPVATQAGSEMYQMFLQGRSQTWDDLYALWKFQSAKAAPADPAKKLETARLARRATNTVAAQAARTSPKDGSVARLKSFDECFEEQFGTAG